MILARSCAHCPHVETRHALDGGCMMDGCKCPGWRDEAEASAHGANRKYVLEAQS